MIDMIKLLPLIHTLNYYYKIKVQSIKDPLFVNNEPKNQNMSRRQTCF